MLELEAEEGGGTYRDPVKRDLGLEVDVISGRRGDTFHRSIPSKIDHGSHSSTISDLPISQSIWGSSSKPYVMV